jgi:telomerase protein component 1
MGMGSSWFGLDLRELGFSGLTVDQLHAVLSAWRFLPKGTKIWEEAVAAGNCGDPYPMAPFAYLVQSLRRYRGPWLSFY